MGKAGFPWDVPLFSFFLMRSRKPKMPTPLLTHTNKSHHVELCGAIWNTHECASHLPAHGSRALFLPAMRRPGFLPSPLRAQLRCPQTTFENLREPCRITNANHCKFRVIQSLITWKILENRGVMWNHVEPVESAYFKWSQGQIFPMPAGRGSSSKLISKPKEVSSSVLPSDVL